LRRGVPLQVVVPCRTVAVTDVGALGGTAVVELLGVAEPSFEGGLAPTALVATTLVTGTSS
jgi:hypothetical protein